MTMKKILLIMFTILFVTGCSKTSKQIDAFDAEMQGLLKEATSMFPESNSMKAYYKKMESIKQELYRNKNIKEKDREVLKDLTAQSKLVMQSAESGLRDQLINDIEKLNKIVEEYKSA